MLLSHGELSFSVGSVSNMCGSSEQSVDIAVLDLSRKQQPENVWHTNLVICFFVSSSSGDSILSHLAKISRMRCLVLFTCSINIQAWF